MQVVAVALVLLAVHFSEAFPQQQQDEQLGSLDAAEVPAPEVKPHVSILKQINQINKDGSYVDSYQFNDFKCFNSIGTLTVLRHRTAGN